MLGLNVLSGLLVIPMVGALWIFLLRGDDEATTENARWIALITSVVNFLLALVAWHKYDLQTHNYDLVETHRWLGSGLAFTFGVDGVSMPFVLLTAFLMPLCIASTWKAITKQVKAFLICFLALESAMIGVFVSLDLVLFYVFFEGGLIPMFVIIGVWGGQRRIYAAMKFFLYTLLGSLFMLLAIMAIYGYAGTTDVQTLQQVKFPVSMQYWLWLAFFASFAVKMPMWPVHTWLPDAHVEAPTGGSVVLAAVLLKLGGYGFIRFSLPMFPEASHYFAPLIFALSIVGIIYTSLVAFVQTDMKKVIAYSSVAHMGFVTMGIFSLTEQGIQGAIFQMVSHGLVSFALFLCIGVIYDRMHTREIAAYGGLVERMPGYAFVFLVFILANLGLPGTSGFVGEFLTMLGTFQVSTWVTGFAAIGTILSAGYSLYLYRRVVFGKLTNPHLKGITDLTWRESAIMVPLILFMIYYGFHPQPIVDLAKPAVDRIMPVIEAASHPAPIKAAQAAALPKQD